MQSTETTAFYPHIKEALEKFKRHENDSGSPEVQIIMLTFRMEYISAHTSEHNKDHFAKRSLVRLVHQRRKTIQYLNKQNPAVCLRLTEALKIRFKG